MYVYTTVSSSNFLPLLLILYRNLRCVIYGMPFAVITALRTNFTTYLLFAATITELEFSLSNIQRTE